PLQLDRAAPARGLGRDPARRRQRQVHAGGDHGELAAEFERRQRSDLLDDARSRRLGSVVSPVIEHGVRAWFARLAPPESRHLQVAAGSAALLLAFFVLSEASYVFVFPPRPSALFWLPSGLTVPLFLRSCTARWAPYSLSIAVAE